MSQLVTVEKDSKVVRSDEQSLSIRNRKQSDTPKMSLSSPIKKFGVGGKVEEIHDAGGGTTITICCTCSGSAFYKDIEAFNPKKH